MTKTEIIAKFKENYDTKTELILCRVSIKFAICEKECKSLFPELYNFCNSINFKDVNYELAGHFRLTNDFIIKHYIRNPLDKLKALLNGE